MARQFELHDSVPLEWGGPWGNQGHTSAWRAEVNGQRLRFLRAARCPRTRLTPRTEEEMSAA